MRHALCFAALSLAACQPSSGPESAPPEFVLKVGPISSVDEFEGVYRVAGLGDIDLGELDHGFAVSIDRNTIDVLENCVSTNWTYRFEGQRLVTKPIKGPTCRRALMPEEAAIMDGFDKADRVSRTESNGILIQGGGPDITLFSQ